MDWLLRVRFDLFPNIFDMAVKRAPHASVAIPEPLFNKLVTRKRVAGAIHQQVEEIKLGWCDIDEFPFNKELMSPFIYCLLYTSPSPRDS